TRHALLPWLRNATGPPGARIPGSAFGPKTLPGRSVGQPRAYASARAALQARSFISAPLPHRIDASRLSARSASLAPRVERSWSTYSDTALNAVHAVSPNPPALRGLW